MAACNKEKRFVTELLLLLSASGLDFVFQHSQRSENASYIAYNNVPMGLTHHNGRLFVTMPRRRPGIPATLNVIDLNAKSVGVSPLLRGYPDYERNTLMVSHDSTVYFYHLNSNPLEVRGMSRIDFRY